LTVAILCGLAAAFTVNHIGKPGGDDVIDVPVPRADIPSSTRLDIKTMFVTKPYPRGLVPAAVITDPAKLHGKVAARTLSANLPISERDLFHPSAVIGNLEPGYRAMTLRAGIENLNHGMLMPGARVDIVTVIRDAQEAQRNESRIFLQNIKVLAINTLAAQPEGKSAIPNPVTVTLMLRPDQVERLYLVSSKGHIGMVLRKPGDTERIVTPGAKVAYDGERDPAEGVAPIRAFVALKTLEPGRVIDRFDECFQEMSFQPTQLIDQPLVQRSEIEGKILTRFIAKGQAAMPINFAAPGEVTIPDEHILIIRSGANTQVHKYPIAAPAKKPAEPEGARNEDGA
jgi:Flp pilus assembly protein CpaB